MSAPSADRHIAERQGERYKLGFSFVVIFTFSLVVLNLIGFVPEPPPDAAAAPSLLSQARASERASGPAVGGDVHPVRVVIESVGIDAQVRTPTSRDIAVLDAALLDGAVHYPGSGTLADISNMFIFGHSSHLPVVNNRNFRAFNDLEKVQAGDVIRVESTDRANLYRVRSVELVSANEALIALSSDRKMLTLSTCNSFGAPSDRYVVKADFVRSYELTRPTAYLDNS